MNRGDDVVQVGGSGPLTSLPHNLVIDTGAGSDTVDVENTSVGGNLLLFGGTGSDTFSVGSPSTENLVSVTGSVFIVGGSGGSNTIAVFDADITGNLRIFSSGANDQIQVGFDAGLGIIGVDETATGHVEVGGNLQIDHDVGRRSACSPGAGPVLRGRGPVLRGGACSRSVAPTSPPTSTNSRWTPLGTQRAGILLLVSLGIAIFLVERRGTMPVERSRLPKGLVR